MNKFLLHSSTLFLLIGTSLQGATNSPTAASAPVAKEKSAVESEKNPNPKNMVGLRIADPAGIKIEWDVAYLPTNRTEKCDLYLPTPTPAGNLRPAVLIIHGGGFNDGDKARGRER